MRGELDPTIRALYSAYHVLLDIEKPTSQQVAMLNYVIDWLDRLEIAEAFLAGERWTRCDS